MDEEQQTPKTVESKDKSGTYPDELAYQKNMRSIWKKKKDMNIMWRIKWGWMSWNTNLKQLQ